MIDKVVGSFEAALAGLVDGMTVHIGGFTDRAAPILLVEAVLDTGAKELTVVANGAGAGDRGLARLVREKRVTKVVCSFPTGSLAAREAIQEGRLELEVCPQGSLVERIRAAGAGLGGILTPTGVGTELGDGKTVLEVDGRPVLLERPLKADFALIGAWRADRWGNLAYRYARRDFNPYMAMAATCTVVQVAELVREGIPATDVHTPGIFVQRVIQVSG